MDRKHTCGFTLIELSIVLVIIGLIVGGVLVGRDLITAAEVRATISQIEKYNTAVHTFQTKYNCLPGDCASAAELGFAARGQYPGQGDGNGLIEGVGGNSSGQNAGDALFGGETMMFWVDLSAAELIDGSFTQDNILAPPGSVSGMRVPLYMPAAKLGGGNYIYVWSGGWEHLFQTWNNVYISSQPSDGINYFGLSGITGGGTSGMPNSIATLTVQQAYNIDTKIDDGLPQSGHVMTMYDGGLGGGFWATGLGGGNLGDYNSTTGGPVTSSGDIGDGTPGGPNSCYDGSQGLPEQYSMGQNHGDNTNCALSFRFQ